MNFANGPTPDDLMPLTDPRMMEACGFTSQSAVYNMRRRSMERIANGSDEAPFPLPYDRIGNTCRYSLAEVVAFHDSHTRHNNPSLPGWSS
jgi:hypothetical protein